MVSASEKSKSNIIQKIIDQINKKITSKKAQPLVTFAKEFYSTTSKEDLAERDPELWAQLVKSQYQFLKERKPGTAKVRVYNPNLKEHGWTSKYTIIEVSNDDMPFLVDSIRMEVNRQGFNIHFMIHVGGLKIVRDRSTNNISAMVPRDEPTHQKPLDEAFIYIEIDRQIDPAVLKELQAGIQKVLQEVRLAVTDWPKMMDRVREALTELEVNPPPVPVAEIEEAKEFLRWIADNHFTFIGARDYVVIGKGKQKALQMVEGSGLGILRDTLAKSHKPRLISSLPLAAQKLASSPEILVVSETNTRSPIHRADYAKYIGVKRYDKQGNIIGEHRFIGLYTSAAYHSNPKDIPYLRKKVTEILHRSKLPPNGHAGKDLLNIIETLPRDDLFQTPVDKLYELSMGILHLQERQRIRLFVSEDIYQRFVSCFVFLPREIMNTDLGQAMQDILMKAFNGVEVTYSTTFTQSILARIHFLIRIDKTKPLKYNVKELEQKLIHVARSWRDELKELIINKYGEEEGLEIINKYVKAFPPGYRDDFNPHVALSDIAFVERLSVDNPLGLYLYHPEDESQGTLRFRLYQVNYPIPLSDVLPILENMGTRVIGELPHDLTFKDGTIVWINDFGLAIPKNFALNVAAIKEKFQQAFRHVWHGEAENDRFNSLVLSAELDWREITILRAYAKYMKQIGFTFNQSYIEDTMVANFEIAKDLIALFETRFDPKFKGSRQPLIDKLTQQILNALDKVSSLDQDRILRRFLELIQATLRTNYYQLDKSNSYKNYLSLKLNPILITELPLPRPMFEVFVYSARVEAVHLRSSKVARGGIRWSDRREDFRTEILDLMKTQKVKNALIVPSGAKGGFVAKCLPQSNNRDAIMEEVTNCYRTFIRGLLDITDNLKGTKVVPPVNVVAYDDPDTYLVVAADKGTATFSDTANAIAAEYHFWLGDAFASGGSAGYDHKKMGITARGAWESVKRHFRELNMDIQKHDFTVVGIGDMSGDVFGNGMLLSRHIKLVAAFNHMHIFLDPNPNPEKSFKERQRLFNLPRSTWEDYDPNLLSPGGGVFSRSAKSIKLTPQVRELLNVDKEAIVPNDLIRAILTAQVDLLWNGGIGTYVKAVNETAEDVGDRANDAIRVNGVDLRCRVVGEGGNLGFTQLGRVEFDLNGGAIYTDFIDNSGGVDCSDHEVNIKILLNQVIADDKLNEKSRNKLLADMTTEVADLVLRDNYLQTQAISFASYGAYNYSELYRYYIQQLETSGRIDRQLEYLPDDKTIIERKNNGKGLTKPELAVLLAYTKNIIKEEILNSDLPEDPHLINVVTSAFPEILAKRFGSYMDKHRLRREIIATQLSNSVVNEMGITFGYRLYDETGATPAAIGRAYAVARHIFALEDLWVGIEALDGKVPATVQFYMIDEVTRLVRRATRWFLRNRRLGFDIGEAIQVFSKGVAILTDHIPTLLSGENAEQLKAIELRLKDIGVSEDLARRIACARTIFYALDIIEAARIHKLDIITVSNVYFALNQQLELGWFREQVTIQSVETHWDALVREAIRDDLDLQQRDLSVAVLKLQSKAKGVDNKIQQWTDRHITLIERWQKMLIDLRSSGNLNYTKLTVAVRELMDLTQASLTAQSAK